MKMVQFFIKLLPIYFICTLFISTAFSLTCYECHERKAGDWCSKPKKQECNKATSVCLKYLHKEGKPGFPNHVIAKCELRTYYTQNKINACERSVRNRNGALTVSETCTCDTDLCNDASLSAAKMVELEKEGGLGKEAAPVAETAPDESTEAPEEHTEAPETPETPEKESDEHEDGDEAVESHTPEVKDMDEDDDEAEEKKAAAVEAAENGATKVSQFSHAIAIVILQFLFCTLRW